MAVLLAIEAFAPAVALRTSSVAYPLVSALHILGIGLLVGTVLTIDIGILVGGQAWRLLLELLDPIVRVGFALVAATGALLFAVQATTYVQNPAFLVKVAFICMGLLNVMAFRRLLKHSGEPASVLALKVSAATSAVAWIGALFAGRLIGFTM